MKEKEHEFVYMIAAPSGGVQHMSHVRRAGQVGAGLLDSWVVGLFYRGQTPLVGVWEC